MNKSKNLIFFLLVGIIFFGWTIISKAEQTSIRNEVFQITDCVGREVVIKKGVKKIVDLTMLDGVRTLIELDAHHLLVGLNHSSHQIFNDVEKTRQNYILVSQVAPELKNLVSVGTIKEPNIEMIISLQPDVILIDSMAKSSARDLEMQTNIPVVCIGTFGNFNYDLFKMLGEITGQEARANKLVTYLQNKLKIITDRVDEIPSDQRKRLFYWSHAFPGHAPKTNGNYEAFEIAGGKNVAREGKLIPKGVYEVTFEQLIAWNPEYIFLHFPFIDNNNDWLTVDDIKNNQIVKGVDAVVQGNVYNLKGELSGWDMATEATEVLYVAKILYPEKFKDLDIEKENNEILKKFYRLEGLYTDMSKKLQLYRWK